MKTAAPNKCAGSIKNRPRPLLTLLGAVELTSLVLFLIQNIQDRILLILFLTWAGLYPWKLAGGEPPCCAVSYLNWISVSFLTADVYSNGRIETRLKSIYCSLKVLFLKPLHDRSMITKK